MSARFVTAKVLGSLATLAFVVAFNFFLFRVVEGDPVANLFRGRNLSQSQRAELTKQFGLDGSTGEQFVRYVGQTAQLNLGRSYTDQPARRLGDLATRRGRRSRSSGISTLLSTVFGVMLGIAAGWRRRTKTDYSVTTLHHGDLRHAGLLARHAAAHRVRRCLGLVPGRRHRRPQLRRDRAWRSSPTRPSTCSCPG